MEGREGNIFGYLLGLPQSGPAGEVGDLERVLSQCRGFRHRFAYPSPRQLRDLSWATIYQVSEVHMKSRSVAPCGSSLVVTPPDPESNALRQVQTIPLANVKGRIDHTNVD